MNDPEPRRLYQRGWFWLAAAALAGSILAHEFWFKGPPAPREPTFMTERFQVPQEAVTKLTIKPVKAIDGEIADDELVLSVSVANETRAYSLDMMYAAPHTKVLNDTLAGRPLAVTWCEKCMSGVVFDRNAQGNVLTFAVFGSLWRDTIVLYDTETWTQWSQWDGQAKIGPHAGQTLSVVPCVIADWKSWRQQYPDGTVALLDEKRAAFDAQAYAKAEDFVLLAGEGRHVKAWDLAEIRRRGVINDTLAGEPVAAVYLPSSGAALLFERYIQGESLTLVWRDGQLRDAESDSTWNSWTGEATAGPREGQALTTKASRIARRIVWKRLSS